MARRKLKDKNTRKLIRLGGSLVVSIPKEFLTDLKWREKQRVIVKRSGKKLAIVDWPEKKKR